MDAAVVVAAVVDVVGVVAAVVGVGAVAVVVAAIVGVGAAASRKIDVVVVEHRA